MLNQTNKIKLFMIMFKECKVPGLKRNQ